MIQVCFLLCPAKASKQTSKQNTSTDTAWDKSKCVNANERFAAFATAARWTQKWVEYIFSRVVHWFYMLPSSTLHCIRIASSALNLNQNEVYKIERGVFFYFRWCWCNAPMNCSFTECVCKSFAFPTSLTLCLYHSISTSLSSSLSCLSQKTSSANVLVFGSWMEKPFTNELNTGNLRYTCKNGNVRFVCMSFVFTQ